MFYSLVLYVYFYKCAINKIGCKGELFNDYDNFENNLVVCEQVDLNKVYLTSKYNPRSYHRPKKVTYKTLSMIFNNKESIIYTIFYKKERLKELFKIFIENHIKSLNSQKLSFKTKNDEFYFDKHKKIYLDENKKIDEDTCFLRYRKTKIESDKYISDLGVFCETKGSFSDQNKDEYNIFVINTGIEIGTNKNINDLQYYEESDGFCKDLNKLQRSNSYQNVIRRSYDKKIYVENENDKISENKKLFLEKNFSNKNFENGFNKIKNGIKYYSKEKDSQFSNTNISYTSDQEFFINFSIVSPLTFYIINNIRDHLICISDGFDKYLEEKIQTKYHNDENNYKYNKSVSNVFKINLHEIETIHLPLVKEFMYKTIYEDDFEVDYFDSIIEIIQIINDYISDKLEKNNE